MSVVPTHVWDPHYMDFHPDRNVYLTSWLILSVLFLTGGEMACRVDIPTRVEVRLKGDARHM